MIKNVILIVVLVFGIQLPVFGAMAVTDPGAYAKFAEQMQQLQKMQAELNKMSSMLTNIQQGQGVMSDVISLQKEMNNIYGNYENIVDNMSQIANVDYSQMSNEDLLRKSQDLSKLTQDSLVSAAQAQGIVIDNTANNMARMQQLENTAWATDSVVGQGQVTNAMLSSIGNQISMMSTAVANSNNMAITIYQQEREAARIGGEKMMQMLKVTRKPNM